MKFKKLGIAVSVAVALAGSGFSASAETAAAACGTTENQWVGEYQGTADYDNGTTHALTVSITRNGGPLRVKTTDANAVLQETDATLQSGNIHWVSTNGDPLWIRGKYDSTSAKCGQVDTVTQFTGTSYVTVFQPYITTLNGKFTVTRKP
jgi:hypothetical protein